MGGKSTKRRPRRLYAAVPYDDLIAILENGLGPRPLARSKSHARKLARGGKSELAIVRVDWETAEREGIAFKKRKKVWTPLGAVEPFLLGCRDKRALGKLGVKRKKSAGGLIVSSLDDPRVMLMFRQKGEATSWKTPKGGIARGETLRQAARREVLEESGIANVRILGRLGRMQYFRREPGGRFREKTVNIFLMLNRDGETGIAPRDGEHFVSCAWLSPAEAMARVTQPQARALIARVPKKLERA